MNWKLWSLSCCDCFCSLVMRAALWYFERNTTIAPHFKGIFTHWYALYNARKFLQYNLRLLLVERPKWLCILYTFRLPFIMHSSRFVNWDVELISHRMAIYHFLWIFHTSLSLSLVFFQSKVLVGWLKAISIVIDSWYGRLWSLERTLTNLYVLIEGVASRLLLDVLNERSALFSIPVRRNIFVILCLFCVRGIWNKLLFDSHKEVRLLFRPQQLVLWWHFAGHPLNHG